MPQTAELDAAARNNLSDSQFAYIDSKGGRHLPIADAAHVRAALARFDQTSFESASAKAAAHAKILAAAKRLGVDVAEKKQADDPGAGDVHVDGPVNSGAGKRKSPLLKRLMRGLRKRVASARYLTAEDLEAEYRSALGHAGGTSRAAAEPADAEVCPSCAAAGHGATPGCTCPACQEGDPEDCECQEIFDQDEDDIDPSQASERHFYQVEAGTGETLCLFMEMEQLDQPGWINVLPKPGIYKSPKYGDIPISDARNANFVRNFKDGVYQTKLPIDAEHESKLSGALGWMTDARQNSDGSVDAQVDWTDRGRLMLASDKFKYFSPEWYDKWDDPATNRQYADVMVGGALTTRPFFKEGSLRPLFASEHGIRVGNDPQLVTLPPDMGTHSTTSPGGQQETKTMADTKTTTEETPVKEATPKAAQISEPKTVQLSEDEVKRFREMESEAKTAKEEAAAAKTAAEEARTRVTELERENRRRTFAETAAPWHGDTAGHVDFLEALPTDELRQQYTEQQTSQATALAEAQQEAKLFRSVGVAGSPSTDSALGKINAAAEAIRATEPKLTIEAARAQALKTNPELYREYQAEAAN